MYQPPVHSPARLSSVLAAMEALLPERGERSRTRLRTLLSARYRARTTMLYASGTQALTGALQLAARALEDPAPLVALPAYTCYDVASAAIGAGVPFTFFDLDPETLSPTESEVRRVLDEGARVIVASPLFGLPLDWDAVVGPSAAVGAIVIEDASQAAGGEWRGVRLGGLGDISVLSFGRGKGWTGGGGGALLIHSDSTLDSKVEPPAGGPESGIRRAIASAAQWALGRPGLYGIPARVPGLGLGETHFSTPGPGAAMPGYSASLAYRTAPSSSRAAERRRDIAIRIRSESVSVRGVQHIRVPGGSTPGFLRLPVLARRARRGEILPGRFRRLGMSGGYPLPLPAVPQIVAHGFEGPSRFAGAERLAHELVTLPTHEFIGEAEIASLIRALPNLPEA